MTLPSLCERLSDRNAVFILCRSCSVKSLVLHWSWYLTPYISTEYQGIGQRKAVPVHTMKVYGGSGDIAPLILNLHSLGGWTPEIVMMLWRRETFLVYARNGIAIPSSSTNSLVPLSIMVLQLPV